MRLIHGAGIMIQFARAATSGLGCRRTRDPFP
jgi:hypothetical protein